MNENLNSNQFMAANRNHFVRSDDTGTWCDCGHIAKSTAGLNRHITLANKRDAREGNTGTDGMPLR